MRDTGRRGICGSGVLVLLLVLAAALLFSGWSSGHEKGNVKGFPLPGGDLVSGVPSGALPPATGGAEEPAWEAFEAAETKAERLEGDRAGALLAFNKTIGIVLAMAALTCILYLLQKK